MEDQSFRYIFDAGYEMKRAKVRRAKAKQNLTYVIIPASTQIREFMRRKLAKNPYAMLSALFREAVVVRLKRETEPGNGRTSHDAPIGG
jgi:hypothetical protein